MISILILFVAYTFYYVKKLSLLNKFNADENLKSNLSNLVTTLTSYLRFYKLSYTILYPVYFFLGVIFGLIEVGTNKFIDILTQPKTIGYLLAVAIIFLFLGTWFSNWYLKKLYGKHLEKLQSVLTELNTID